MATVLSQRSRKEEQTTTARTQASFLRAQLILLSSRRKFGLLYCVATVAGLFSIPGVLSVMGSETDVLLLLQRTIPLPFISLMIALGIYILNDLVDVDLDKASSKNRPIPSGLVSKKQAWSFIMLTNGAGALLSLVTFNEVSMILVVFMTVIGILYSAPKIALMNRVVLKNVAITSFYVLCTMLGITWSYGTDLALNNSIVSIHSMAMSGIMIFVGSIVNDLGDARGDKAGGRQTIPIVIGGKNTVNILIVLVAGMPAISWMLYGTFLEHDTMSLMTPIAVTIVGSLALLRMANIQKVFEDMELMRKQHKKWFPLHIVLQSGFVVGALSPL
jgi:geranylgeranylglycerol-phosphate geranylgeranyltransferase